MFCGFLFEICPISLVTNHQNYAQWMTYYVLELVNKKNAKLKLEEVQNEGSILNK